MNLSKKGICWRTFLDQILPVTEQDFPMPRTGAHAYATTLTFHKLLDLCARPSLVTLAGAVPLLCGPWGLPPGCTIPQLHRRHRAGQQSVCPARCTVHAGLNAYKHPDLSVLDLSSHPSQSCSEEAKSDGAYLLLFAFFQENRRADGQLWLHRGIPAL